MMGLFDVVDSMLCTVSFCVVLSTWHTQACIAMKDRWGPVLQPMGGGEGAACVVWVGREQSRATPLRFAAVQCARFCREEEEEFYMLRPVLVTDTHVKCQIRSHIQKVMMLVHCLDTPQHALLNITLYAPLGGGGGAGGTMS